MFVAVDLGASSGRVIQGRVVDGEVELTELLRFPTSPLPRAAGGLRVDARKIIWYVLSGLKLADNPVTFGIDSWAIDYGLVGPDGKVDRDVRSYRDSRTDGMDAKLREAIDDETLYGINGLQFLPFTTVYQLMTEPPERLADHKMLLLPDLITYGLTGTMGAEVTNASTTGLLDATTRQWSAKVMESAGIPQQILPPLRQPGEHSGVVRDYRYGEVQLMTVASHDTASAVFAIPNDGPGFGYISCGTWSLVGVLLDQPVLSEPARAANFTNEAGVDGKTRFLRNTMGLWLLSECLREWDEPLEPLLAAAEDEPPFAAVFDPDDPIFLPPGDMPSRIAQRCRAAGQTPPAGRPGIVRAILESLALAHAAALHAAAVLADREIEMVHLVGGGAHNRLLCRLTADACGLPVLAGPVEASALGNILVQARSAGLPARPSRPFARYLPLGPRSPWRDAAASIGLSVG